MTTTATRKPRLTYRQQAMALADQLGVTITLNDDLPGLNGTMTAPAGHVFPATGEPVIELAYEGKREAAWPLLAKELKKGLEDAPVVEEPATRTGVEFAAPATLDALYGAVVATMTSRQVASWNRTSRAYGPHGLTAEYRAAYHLGWAAAGKRTVALSTADRMGKPAGFLDGFDDRRNGCEPWTTPACVPTGRQEQAMNLSEVTL